MYVKGTPDIETTYKYNEEGIRVEKSIKNLSNSQVTTTTYKVQGNKVIEETTGSNNIHYYYDINNSLIGFKHNNKNYYYEKSVLNDIIGIVNDEGTTVVKYEYDAYGNITNIEDTSGINLSTLNSYKYKDCYYDNESSYYYLNSRYYNPEVRRFINADGFVSTGTGILGYNMYAYTENNPINYSDAEGKFPFFAAIVAVVVTSVMVYIRTNAVKTTKKEIEKIQTKQNAVESTAKIDELLKKNAAAIKKDLKNKNRIQKYRTFISSVKTGAKYDLKVTSEWANKTLKYNDVIMEPQDLGNLNYGYIGRAAGFSEFELTSGAGLYQVISGTSNVTSCLSARCDDPRDSYYIRMGIIKYDSEN